MNTKKRAKRNRKMYSTLFTVCLALLATISVFVATYQVEAWFKNFATASTDAVLTNFETKVKYAVDDNSWEQAPAGTSIPIVIENGDVKLDVSRLSGVTAVPNSLQIQVTYNGKSSAYLRASVKAVFQNKHTGTVLPALNLSFSGSDKWVTSGDYIYYTEKCGEEHDGTKTPDQYVKSHNLYVFTVSLGDSNPDISKYQDYKGDLYIVVDTVQPDRYEAFWGLESLPF